MGMKAEEAFARAKEATKEGIEAVIDGRPDLTEPQRVQVRKAGTVALARELASTYARPAATEQPRMGMQGHPATAAGGGQALSVRVRAMQADPVVLARIKRATSEEDTAGLHLEVPGHILAWSPSQMLKEHFGAFKRAQREAQKGAPS